LRATLSSGLRVEFEPVVPSDMAVHVKQVKRSGRRVGFETTNMLDKFTLIQYGYYLKY